MMMTDTSRKKPPVERSERYELEFASILPCTVRVFAIAATLFSRLFILIRGLFPSFIQASKTAKTDAQREKERKRKEHAAKILGKQAGGDGKKRKTESSSKADETS